MRRLLRFTSTALNQGTGDFSPPAPKTRPDLFSFGACHQHYHYRSFAEYHLYDENGPTGQLVLTGQKYAYCMEDTAHHFPGGKTVGCKQKYDCGSQGIQKGWIDSYGWSLDCSWIDITDVAAGTYVLYIKLNPDKVFMELDFNNNEGKATVTIPARDPGTVLEALKLEAKAFVPKPSSASWDLPASIRGLMKSGYSHCSMTQAKVFKSTLFCDFI
jgi:hypothetical protein